MQPEQYALTSFAEDHHWWFLGWRHLLERCLHRGDLKLPARPRILDAGCGTGGNLRFFAERFSDATLLGFDNSPLALEFARRKCPTAMLVQGDICSPRLPEQEFDLILCCDVIYVPGMTAALPGLRTLANQLVTGGLFIIHLPAYRWLTSRHDRVMHTSQRFVLAEALNLLEQLQLERLRASYRLSMLLPLLVVARLPSILSQGRYNATTSDLRTPSPWLNRCLLRVVQIENHMIASGATMPFGSSIMVIGKRK